MGAEMGRKNPVVVIAIAILLAVAGCAQPPRPPQVAVQTLSPGEILDGGLAADPFAEQTAIEESIRTCMKTNGFDYFPPTLTSAAPADIATQDRRAHVASVGFGWTTFIGEPGLDPWLSPPAPSMSAAQDAYLASLTESELELYNLAMMGDPDDQGATAASRWGTGCFGRAYSELYAGGPSNPWNDDNFAAQLRSIIDELDAQVEADPRTLKLGETWRSCMYQQGFAFADSAALMADGYTDFRSRLGEIIGEEYLAGPSPFSGWTQDDIDDFNRTVTDASWAALVADEREALPSIDNAALGRLQNEERTLALVDFDCTEANREEAEVVRADIKADFLEAHLGEIIGIREAYLADLRE